MQTNKASIPSLFLGPVFLLCACAARPSGPGGDALPHQRGAVQVQGEMANKNNFSDTKHILAFSQPKLETCHAYVCARLRFERNDLAYVEGIVHGCLFTVQ